MIFQGISPSFWGSLADVWGRRPIYLATLSVYMASCIGLALAPVYWVLLVLRMLQAFGSSSVIALGAGVVGDIATPSERGHYFGLFSMGQMAGPVIGPLAGGLISHYLSWRWIFWILLILSGVLLIVILFCLPETLAPLEDDQSGTTVTPHMALPFKYLLEKDVMACLVYNGIHYATYYCYLTSTTSQFTTLYHLSQIQIGLCFLCQGVGCVLASFVEGKLLDRDFNSVAHDMPDDVSKLPTDFPIFKARLRSMYVNAGLIQMITLFYGWMLFIRAPLAVVLVLQFMVGFCNTCLFNIFQTLMVDLFPQASASITATNNLVRCLLGAVATVSIEPGIQCLGVGWMFTLMACICITSNGLVPVILVWGPQWRSTREINKR